MNCDCATVLHHGQQSKTPTLKPNKTKRLGASSDLQGVFEMVDTDGTQILGDDYTAKIPPGIY